MLKRNVVYVLNGAMLYQRQSRAQWKYTLHVPSNYTYEYEIDISVSDWLCSDFGKMLKLFYTFLINIL